MVGIDWPVNKPENSEINPMHLEMYMKKVGKKIYFLIKSIGISREPHGKR